MLTTELIVINFNFKLDNASTGLLIIWRIYQRPRIFLAFDIINSDKQLIDKMIIVDSVLKNHT